MKYRHSFHAGNFADVHKHIALLALLRALQHKNKGFLYLDTHAGRGLYDMRSNQSRRSGEARDGFQRIIGVTPACAEIADYQQCVSRLRETMAPLNAYPGSPLLVASVLRAQDRGLAFEALASECRALERALGDYPAMQARCGDGWSACAALLPPPERRALVLIDPPYETGRSDFERALSAAATALARLSNAVVAIWYPIKDERDLQAWRKQASESLPAPVLQSELWLYPRDSSVALNGSGLLIANPPFEFDSHMALWLPELAVALGAGTAGGQSQRWLVPQD